MKTVRMTFWVVAVVAMIAGQARAGFNLTGSEHLDVVTGPADGVCQLWDFSSVDVLPGGSIPDLYAWNNSSVTVSGGSIDRLLAFESTRVNMTSGYVDEYLVAHQESSVVISGGAIHSLRTYVTSNTNMTGGTIYYTLSAFDDSSIDVSGGSIRDLYASNNSSVTFHGYDFGIGTGLVMDGNRVLGTGILTGKWFDDTSWAINIRGNAPTATILAVPEPATLLLFGLGAVILRKLRA